MLRLRAMIGALALFGLTACAATKPAVQTEAPAPPSGVLTQLTGDQGIIFAEALGGSVELRVLETGKTAMLTDGSPVTFKEQFAAESMGRAEAQIESKGQLGVVPNARVITAKRLTPSPNGKNVVYSAIHNCPAACQRELWVLDASAETRVRLTTEGSDKVVVALRPDGAELAVGSGGLYLVNLGDMMVRRYPAFSAPAYAPDGTLVARGIGEDDAAYEIGRGGMAAEVARMDGSPGVEESSPVRFERGGAIMVVDFVRDGEVKQMRKSR